MMDICDLSSLLSLATISNSVCMFCIGTSVGVSGPLLGRRIPTSANTLSVSGKCSKK